MLKVIFVLTLLVTKTATGLKTCQSTDFKYEYTECDGSGGRWRVQVPKTPDLCEGGNPASAVRGKSCNFKCEKGQYLDISGDQQCKPCPPGSYSLGDGIRYEDWSKIPEDFISTAESFNFYDEESRQDRANCTENEFIAKGAYISALPGQCNAQLSYSMTLVNPGTVYFEYQFSEESSGTALFHFTVQNNQCDESSGRNSAWPEKTSKGKWGHLRTPLKQGLNVLKWRVVGIGTHHQSPKIPVLIRKIEITGVGFTSECPKCKKGTYSSSGAEICTPCKPNTYSDVGADICQPCDLTKTYSYEGASNCTDRPACTTNDYYQYQLPCVNGKTQKTYEWVQPQICRADLPNSASLPKKTAQEDCPPCNPGMFLGENGCQFCPEGQMSEDGKTPCKECPASTSPDYKLEYNWWNTLPSNMTSECVVFDAFTPDSSCRYNSSWIPNGDHLQTQFARGEDAYLLLIQQISGFRTLEAPDKNKVVGTISFDFSTTCAGKCVFVFIVERSGESVVQKDWTGSNGKTHFSLDITQSGPVSFSWAFQRSIVGSFRSGHVAESDMAQIYHISVTNALDGGAVGCQKCPKGVVNDRCVPCPPGHYIDANSTSCEACPARTIIRSGNSWGSESCEECGQGLKASSQGDTCVTDCKFTDKMGRQYDFTPLNKVLFVKGSNLFTGSGTKYYHGFNISLCGGDKLVTCSQNVSEPSQSKGRFSSPPPVQGVVCRSTIIPSSDEEKSLSTQPTSLGDYITKVVVNKSLEEMYKKEGLETDGIENDIHFYSRSKGSTDACPNGRNTIISLRCDQKMDEDGEIVFPPKCIYGTCDGCNFHLLWKTVYACPICRKEDFTMIVGECTDGSQDVHYTKPDHCRGDVPPIETKKCSIKLPFIVKIVVPPVVILGLVLLICVIYCWQRNKSLEYKYMKLVHNNEPNYEGELPGVDSCALSDGEEDQFDSVQFKESRGSKFLNKLRGKKSDKDDENPFETGRSEKIPLT